jgi:hypothetical protein
MNEAVGIFKSHDSLDSDTDGRAKDTKVTSQGQRFFAKHL